MQNKTAYNIRVVNLSLGSTAIDSWTNDPVCVKVKELVNAGIVVIAAAGNLGKTSTGQKVYGRIHSPGNSPYVITVGASNSFHRQRLAATKFVTTYSSRGPTRSYFTTSTGTKVYDNLIKPDLVAPGNKLVSYKAPITTLADPKIRFFDRRSNGTNDAVMQMSGTSMSTPVVTGAAALLLQVNPNLTPGMIKMILQYTADPIAGANTFEQGAGELNLEGAVRLGEIAANRC